ncbi:nudix-type nucleoside diphosphatase (YffH/AdpP family) [Aliiruegeria haliotis]|uniref:ADP-ribose pyrophosphatase n=1 Tax=Aliiruegeria haliotis TaxID=1280846 RepID=A0A2T0RUP8_9RHOB|nr:NUDIX domain-containing protein [Aliiruegeria haliotis]PRY24852.1 nudix-type nucleoside diphosphatase (YffH/AdpP family) [Aliiruegeria haliotis]
MDGIFLYGMLCHSPLLTVVTGGEPLRLTPARLPDHAVHWTRGDNIPLLIEAPGEVTDGLLLEMPSDEAMSRLEYYQNSFDALPAEVDVETDAGPARARLYRGRGGEELAGDRWDLAEWVARWGELTLVTVQEIMDDMEVRPASEVARRFGPMRARGQARLNARQVAPSTLRRTARPEDVDLRRRSLVYSNFFSVEEYDFSHATFAGGRSREMNRTAFISADAVTVLPYDPVRDRVLLVEQFRAGPFARGDTQPWMLEAIAGRIDGGETPQEAARRESLEEAGLELGALHLVSQYYPTPGAKTEYLFGYIGVADLPDGSARLGGLPSEDEDIRSHVISFDRALELVESGEINVGPLILLILHLERKRDALRAG